MLRTAAQHLRRAYRPQRLATLPQTRALCDSPDDAAFVPVTSRSFEHIHTSLEDRIAVVEIHRPRDMNMLSSATLSELADAVCGFDADPAAHAIVITGSSRVFAAGSDVSEQLAQSASSLRRASVSQTAIDRVAAARTPTIAAVSGFALGAGCELVLAADIVIAAEDATFGTPHIQLGTMPGDGGTQRLARAVGKAKAMELVLTGRQMTAEEAERAGLVTRVAQKGEALVEAKEVAKIIARHSAPVVAAAKECVNVAFETALSEGIRFERRAMQAAFDLDDRKEGMKAFVDGRKPKFSDR